MKEKKVVCVYNTDGGALTFEANTFYIQDGRVTFYLLDECGGQTATAVFLLDKITGWTMQPHGEDK